jgi:hypothetical protein
MHGNGTFGLEMERLVERWNVSPRNGTFGLKVERLTLTWKVWLKSGTFGREVERYIGPSAAQQLNHLQRPFTCGNHERRIPTPIDCLDVSMASLYVNYFPDRLLPR